MGVNYIMYVGHGRGGAVDRGDLTDQMVEQPSTTSSSSDIIRSRIKKM